MTEAKKRMKRNGNDRPVSTAYGSTMHRQKPASIAARLFLDASVMLYRQKGEDATKAIAHSWNATNRNIIC
jgi:hypothetical protein